MIRKHLFMTERQIERLDAIVEASGLPIGEVIRRAIDEYLDREEKRYELQEGEE